MEFTKPLLVFAQSSFLPAWSLAWGAPSAMNTGAILPADHKNYPCWGGCVWNWELILTTHTRRPFRKSSTTSPRLSHTPPSSQKARGQRQKAVCILTRQKKISHLKKKTLWQCGNSSASEDERSVCSVDVTHVVVIIWEEDPIVLNAAPVPEASSAEIKAALPLLVKGSGTPEESVTWTSYSMK